MSTRFQWTPDTHRIIGTDMYWDQLESKDSWLQFLPDSGRVRCTVCTSFKNNPQYWSQLEIGQPYLIVCLALWPCTDHFGFQLCSDLAVIRCETRYTLRALQSVLVTMQQENTPFTCLYCGIKWYSHRWSEPLIYLLLAIYLQTQCK